MPEAGSHNDRPFLPLIHLWLGWRTPPLGPCCVQPSGTGCANDGYRILSVMRHHAFLTIYDSRIFRIEERNRDVSGV